jgi:tetratricopeptide (TPR) repeat protein
LQDDYLEVTWLLGMEATLLRDLRRISQSLDRLDRGLKLARSGEAKACLWIAKANTLKALDDYEGAVAALEQLLAAPAGLAPRLEWLAQYTLADTHRHLERFEQAAALLPAVREGVRRWNNQLDHNRVLWLEGSVLAGLGRKAEACAKLEQVRRELTDQAVAYDAALVSLELAVLYLADARLGEVQALALEMAPIFQGQGIHREALAALRLFCLAAERGEISDAFIRRLAKYLERARYDHSLSFESE